VNYLFHTFHPKAPAIRNKPDAISIAYLVCLRKEARRLMKNLDKGSQHFSSNNEPGVIKGLTMALLWILFTQNY
jgi:hypothetical protein